MPTDETTAPIARRQLLRTMFGSALGLGLTALGAAAGVWAAATARFFVPNVLNQPPSRFHAGSPADYPLGTVETRFKASHGVWIVHSNYQGKPQIYALATACTHLGCITLWLPDQQKFKCPCHGSVFSQDGINREGPAPRPLPRYAIRVAEDGQLEVDRSQQFHEQLGQWNNPASYVTA